jgi:hypothetical protein
MCTPYAKKNPRKPVQTGLSHIPSLILDLTFLEQI